MMKCAYCEKELPNPYFVFAHAYCNKHCFHDHMALLTDRNILQRLQEEGTANLRIKQLRSMTRLKLLAYDRNEKKYLMTPRAQKILDETPVQHTPQIPQADLARC